MHVVWTEIVLGPGQHISVKEKTRQLDFRIASGRAFKQPGLIPPLFHSVSSNVNQENQYVLFYILRLRRSQTPPAQQAEHDVNSSCRKTNAKSPYGDLCNSVVYKKSSIKLGLTHPSMMKPEPIFFKRPTVHTK